MVVAFRTLQARAEEHLGHVRGHLVQLVVAVLPQPVDRGRVLPLTGRRDHAAHELVVGAVSGDLILEPVVERDRGLIRAREVRVAEDRAPLHREVRRVVARIEQLVDELCTLIGGFVVE